MADHNLPWHVYDPNGAYDEANTTPGLGYRPIYVAYGEDADTEHTLFFVGVNRKDLPLAKFVVQAANNHAALMGALEAIIIEWRASRATIKPSIAMAAAETLQKAKLP